MDGSRKVRSFELGVGVGGGLGAWAPQPGTGVRGLPRRAPQAGEKLTWAHCLANVSLALVYTSSGELWGAERGENSPGARGFPFLFGWRVNSNL